MECEMRICYNCGNYLSMKDKFCKKCGVEVGLYVIQIGRELYAGE
jgi:uncharacterized membrane protein YvbJ